MSFSRRPDKRIQCEIRIKDHV